jgi:hypothetical protein
MALSPNNVYQGDCIDLLGKVDPGSVDLVFADPPFNIGYEYDVYDDQQSCKDYLQWSRSWMQGVHASLKPTGTFWLAIGDEYAAELKIIAQETGFSCRSWVIWYYTFGVNCVRGFSRSHTHLFHFVKDPTEFTFNAANPAIRVLSARQLVYADGRANPKGRLPDNTWILRPQDAPGAFTPDHDMWYFARVAGTFKERQGFHGCQMPEQLLGRIVRASSNPRDMVLDPFAGSGTTLAVAKKLGRQWLGTELSEEYVKCIKERLDGTKVGDDLTGPADPLKSAPNTKNGKRKLRIRNGKPVLQSDEKTDQGLVEAYTSTLNGFSIDYMLCDPNLNSQFTAACKERGLKGSPVVWNRLLLRLRKAGKLPKSGTTRKQLSFDEMDLFSYAAEIAMHLLELDYGLTLDDVLSSPDHAKEFDELAREFAPGHKPFEYRWAALSIRKRAIKSKELADDTFSEWSDKPLPAPMSLAKISLEELEAPGVYIFSGNGRDLYVGESKCVRHRVELARQTECWESLGLDSIIYLPTDHQTQHGLQSALAGRLNPLLNSHLLTLSAEVDETTL